MGNFRSHESYDRQGRERFFVSKPAAEGSFLISISKSHDRTVGQVIVKLAILKPIIRASMKAILIVLLFSIHSNLLAADDATFVEVDKFWAKISESVSEGDFGAYRSAHHPDAVLVVNGKSQSMESAHKTFQRGFEDTAAGTVEAGIEFLWTQRSVDADTAFQKGAFRYWSEADGKTYDQYTQFEAILVKGDEGWKLLVQKQYRAMTKEQWDALADGKKKD